MSDRFYKQQLASTGNCPGASLSQQRRKRKMAWDDEKKAQAVQMYLDGEPTPDNSMEIVKEIAETLEESPNGVRMILTKQGVYVKKAPAAKSSSSGGGSTGTGRVSKQAAQDALVAAITDAGQEVDEEIISKMTGKAAQYFTTVLSAMNS
jgi:transposase-like protein